MARTVAERLQTRLDYLKRVQDPGLGQTVEAASAALARIHHEGRAPASIKVRRDFLARPKWIHVASDRDKTPRAKPALATLVTRRGLGLRLELILLFLLQCRPRTTGSIPLPLQPDPEDSASLGLISLFATGNKPRTNSKYKRGVAKMRTAQVTSALDALQELRLVELQKASDGKFDHSQPKLNIEFGPLGGDHQRYRPPPATTTVVSVPIEFFTNGWIQVLTDSEIANWLMWRDVGNMRTAETTTAEELFINADLRLGFYDLSRDVWDTHLTLSQVGLMSVRAGDLHVEETAEGRGYRRDPHMFDLDDAPLKKPALPEVMAAVTRDFTERLK